MVNSPMNNNDKPRVVVFGGTGHYGREIVSHLVQQPQAPVIRVLTRNTANAQAILPQGTEIVQGDVTCSDTIKRVLVGCHAVVISLSAITTNFRQRHEIEQDAVFKILDEMQRQGIHRLVYISGYDIREELLKSLHAEPIGAIPLQVEQCIRKRCDSLDWTILACPFSYEIFFAMLRNNKLFIPGGGKHAIPCVSAQDVGAIAAQVAVCDCAKESTSSTPPWTLRHARIHVCGPEATNFPQMARRLSLHLSREVRVVAIPLWLMNAVSFVMQPFVPMMRFLYYGLKLLNNFPPDLAEQVPKDHTFLLQHFHYEPVTLDMEIETRLAADELS